MVQIKQIVLLFLVGSVFYATVYFLSKYLPYQLSQYWLSSSGQTTLNLIQMGKSDNKLRYLEQLTAMPIVGGFFMNEKIYHLALNNNWTAVMSESEIALSSVLNKQSFQIWYHRGLAACNLQDLEECRHCTTSASFLANDVYQEYYAKYLFEFYEERKQQIGEKQEQSHQLDSNQIEEASANIERKPKVDKQKDKKQKMQKRAQVYNTQQQLIQL